MERIIFTNPGQGQKHYEKDYEEVRLLARGGFGRALLVRSTRDNELYTAKVNMKPTNEGLAAVEQSALETVRHPNIVFKKEAFWDHIDNSGLTLIIEFCQYGCLYN